jgi:argininosuccinate synthase
LRRGDDYTIMETRADKSAYAPEKLSMEKTEAAFTPEDRIGALEMQNLPVLDNRSLLLHYAEHMGRLVGGTESGLGNLLGDGEK